MSTTEALLVAVRAIHFAATLSLFGELVFVLLASDRASSRAAAGLAGSAAEAPRSCRTVVVAWLVAVVSGIGWLLLEASLMSGVPLREGWSVGVLGKVVGSTWFGRAWSARGLLALAFATLWLVARKLRIQDRRTVSIGAATLAAGLVVGLAWAGHANIETGAEGAIHHLDDAVHLLAAGAWLGGLAPLIGRLRRLGGPSTVNDLESAAIVVVRFGNLAAICVFVLVVSGFINSLYTVGAPGALVDTAYGRLLLLKLILFCAMLAIAALNRLRLTPALCARQHDIAARSLAARVLRRNACAEQALAMGILAVVGALGISLPPTGM